MKKKDLPIIYSCSGCSSAAQTANRIAIMLDREGIVEMSCIAGVGGGVKPLVRLAKSGRPIVGLDGCKLSCVKACLAVHNIVPDNHFVLSDYNVEKVNHRDFSEEKAQEIKELILQELKAKNI